jgi:peptidoglycan/LPS O-acetylase OafA/YrhL
MDSKIKTTYRPDIDGLRAVAVLSVVLYHLHGAWLPGGYGGVDIFFVISGFVVASSLAASKVDSFAGFLGEFYARRLARILPALVAVLISTALMSTLFIPKAWLSEFADSTARYAFFGLSNLIMQNNADTYFAPRAEFNPFTHTWSLGVEEQYYLLAPLFVYFWLRAYRRGQTQHAHWAIGILALFMVTSLALCIWLTKHHPAAAFYSIAGRFWELASGALLFLLTQGRQIPVRKVEKETSWHSMSAWLGVFCIAIGLAFAQMTEFPWPWAVLPVVGTLLLIGGEHIGPVGAVRHFLAAPLTVWIGKRSYSIYLWHWPVFVLMRWTVGLDTPALFAVATLTTLALATFSYSIIERPLRHNAWIETRTQWKRIIGFLLMPVVGLLLTNHLFSHRDRYSLSRVMSASADWYATGHMAYPGVGNRKCAVSIEGRQLAGGHVTLFVPKQCSDTARSSKKIYAMGDSHTGMLASLFEQISAEEGVEVSLFTGPGCNLIDFRAPMDATHRSAECLAFTQAMTQHTLDTASPGDIVILSSLRLQRYGDQWASFGIADMYDFMYGPHAMPSRSAAVEDAKQWLQPFANKRLQVVFAAPTPIFKAPPFRCSDWFNSNNPICVGKNQQNRSDLERLRQPIIASMKVLAHTYPNIHVWDAFPVLCPDDICRTEKDGRPLFFDGDHLSAYGNLVIYPSFKATVMNLN